MFYFLNIDSPSESKSYDKGKLFERLCSVIIENVGYTDIDFREKKENLEYDIVARNRLTGKKLVGEAKAYEKKISEQIMTFFAKMSIHWIEDKDTQGVFISVSELTPDVKGQIDRIKAVHSNFRYIVSDEIIDILSTHANYQTIAQIKRKAESSYPLNRTGETYFLVTDRGDFFIQLLINEGMTLPSLYSVYNSYGNQVVDTNFLEIIKEHIDVLKELNYIIEYSNFPFNENNDRSSFLGVPSGSGWFDYHFPAPPDKFIGRDMILCKFNQLIEEVRNGVTTIRVSEILSRSGVGKSSVTLKLENDTNYMGDVGIVVDSRNIRTDTDILNIFQTLLRKTNTSLNIYIELPSNQKEISRNMHLLDKVLKSHKKVAIVFLDQFESIFSKPKVYNQILDIILEFCSFKYNILFCIARKNDQPTTYDESSEIELKRLTAISKAYKLEDFKLPEAESLIDKMKSELGRPLIKSLKEQVLEISNGFPWLLKKFCAHIIKLVKEGQTQTNIMQTGMQLEDLFYEDLEALDELLREFFYRLVNFLPATHADLTEKFNDTDLFYKLTSLQNDYRLIRLTGRTYDTYNDVLKEFVKTGNISLSKRYIFRIYPNQMIVLFEQIIKNNWSNIDQILRDTRQVEGVINNKLKGLRQVELLDGTKDSFKPTEGALKAYNDSKLVEYLSAVLKQNTLVREVINKVHMRKSLKIEDLQLYLQEEMPFIDANESTWLAYARYFATWLQYTQIVFHKNGTLYPLGEELILSMTSTRGILPSIYMQQLERFIETLSASNSPKTSVQLANQMGRKSINGAIADSAFLNLIEQNVGRGYAASATGQQFSKMNKTERRAFISHKLASDPIINAYINEVLNGIDPNQAFENLCEISNFHVWSVETIKWKHKLLRNWLLYSGLIKRKNHSNDENQIEFTF